MEIAASSVSAVSENTRMTSITKAGRCFQDTNPKKGEVPFSSTKVTNMRKM